MLKVFNHTRRAVGIDSQVAYEIKSRRPSIPGAPETLDYEDTLEIRDGRDIMIEVLDDKIVIRGL